MPSTTYQNGAKKGAGRALGDVSDDEEEDVYDPNVPKEEPAASQPETWEDFWKETCATNDAAARAAGADPTKDSKVENPTSRHGHPLQRGAGALHHPIPL